VTCDRLGIKSVSGSVEYAGSLVKGGRYEINSHSGSVRLTLSNPPGFELAANSFSGTIRSDFPMIIGGDRDRDRGRRRGGNNRSIRADRKSTRLNSSHDQISYAVFCLKK